MLCILYVNVIGACLGAGALFLARALPPAWPRRWLWCAVIAISIVLPGVYRTQHPWAVVDPSSHRQTPGLASAAAHAAPRPVLDLAWWAHTDSFDAAINRVSLTTSVALIAWGLASMLWVAGVVRLSRRAPDGSSGVRIVDDVPVVVTRSMGPATVGLWPARVLVPRWVLALPSVQRRYVVRHEEEHRRAHDAQLLFVASLTVILLPWSLALWWQLRRLRLAVEMDCDSRVVTSLGDATAYGELLLRVAQTASRGPRLQPALLGGVGMLERRITALVAPTPLRQVQRFLLPALALAILLVVLSMPHPVPGR